jgi:hypothetical protein
MRFFRLQLYAARHTSVALDPHCRVQSLPPKEPSGVTRGRSDRLYEVSSIVQNIVTIGEFRGWSRRAVFDDLLIFAAARRLVSADEESEELARLLLVIWPVVLAMRIVNY